MNVVERHRWTLAWGAFVVLASVLATILEGLKR